MKRVRKDADIDGKILVCKGASPKPLGDIALRWTFGDPSRHDEPFIDIEKGMHLRIGKDVSVVDARLLLEVEGWRFDVIDPPQEDKDVSDESKGGK
jgi:hypothetical protein